MVTAYNVLDWSVIHKDDFIIWILFPELLSKKTKHYLASL